MKGTEMMNQNQLTKGAFLVAKMADGSRWRLPVEKLLENMVVYEQKYRESEGEIITPEEALEAVWYELEATARHQDQLEHLMSQDGVSLWDDWKDLAVRLPDERPSPEEMWADAKIELCYPAERPH